MKRKYRLRRASDFKRVRSQGKSFGHPWVALLLAPNDLPYSRVAVVAGRSVGKAVQRNRAKRRLRACVERLFPYIRAGWDLILFARPGAVTVPFDDLVSAVTGLLRRGGVLITEAMDQQVVVGNERLSE